MDGEEWRKRIGIRSNESDSYVHIRSQKELDEVPVDYQGDIIIEFGTEEERAILNRKLSAVVRIGKSSVIEIRKPNNVAAWVSCDCAWEVERLGVVKFRSLEED